MKEKPMAIAICCLAVLAATLASLVGAPSAEAAPCRGGVCEVRAVGEHAPLVGQRARERRANRQQARARR